MFTARLPGRTQAAFDDSEQLAYLASVAQQAGGSNAQMALLSVNEDASGIAVVTRIAYPRFYVADDYPGLSVDELTVSLGAATLCAVPAQPAAAVAAASAAAPRARAAVSGAPKPSPASLAGASQPTTSLPATAQPATSRAGSATSLLARVCLGF